MKGALAGAGAGVEAVSQKEFGISQEELMEIAKDVPMTLRRLYAH